MNLAEMQALAERARQRGMDPMERLHAMGLLLSDSRLQQLVREVCTSLADRIEEEPMANLLRGGRQTLSPTDVRQAIVAYIRKYFSEDSV